MDLRQVFALNLRRLRRERGISQENLAYEADVNRTYISTLEKGASYVGLEIIEKLSRVLEAEPAEFFQSGPEPSKSARGGAGPRKDQMG